jgi:hypothetical protein
MSCGYFYLLQSITGEETNTLFTMDINLNNLNYKASENLLLALIALLFVFVQDKSSLVPGFNLAYFMNGDEEEDNHPTNPTDHNPTGQNPTGNNPTGQNPTGHNPAVQNPAGQNPVGQNPTGQNPTTPVGQNPIGQNPAGPNPNNNGQAAQGNNNNQHIDNESFTNSEIGRSGIIIRAFQFLRNRALNDIRANPEIATPSMRAVLITLRDFVAHMAPGSISRQRPSQRNVNDQNKHQNQNNNNNNDNNDGGDMGGGGE